jgi:hypothetical protein
VKPTRIDFQSFSAARALGDAVDSESILSRLHVGYLWVFLEHGCRFLWVFVGFVGVWCLGLWVLRFVAFDALVAVR